MGPFPPPPLLLAPRPTIPPLSYPCLCCCPPAAAAPAPADNVIRAGLTPKLRDTQVLCQSLTYGQGAPEVLEGAKAAASPHLACYRPPFRWAPPAAGCLLLGCRGAVGGDG